jgi:UDP-N-acetyl-D-mannosaminuronic acid dehydrogenase
MGKENVVIVGGGGHVGLPLGLALAKVGHDVISYDISQETVDIINDGNMPFLENGAGELLKQNLYKNFIATTDISVISKASTIIVVIGTPVDEYLAPNPNTVVDVIKEISKYFKENQLLLLRSTLFPGVADQVSRYINENFPKISVAYCPERIIEGNAIQELFTLPQIIGTHDLNVYIKSKKIFESLGVKTIQVSPAEAELAKLFTNVWRYIKFAVANQFYMISNDLGIDYENVKKTISFDYPRAIDLPSAGFTAGPCLFKDTMQLSALMNQKFMLGHSAMLINEGMPGYIIDKLKLKFDLKELNVGILGMSFKANVDDSRGSLAYKLRKLLMFECKEVLVTDAHIKNKNFKELNEVLSKSDLIIIGAPHKEYQHLKFDKPVIDIWNFYGTGVEI